MSASETITIQRRDGCILVHGFLSPGILTALAKEVGDGATIDPDVARLANVNFAFGAPDDLARLRDTLAAEAPRLKRGVLSDGAAEWLAVGEHGLSSATLFWKITGVRPRILREGEAWAPSDPDDLSRCLKLIAMAPEIGGNIGMMRDVSPEWMALVDIWADLVRVFQEEEKSGWRGKTYDMMKKALNRRN